MNSGPARPCNPCPREAQGRTQQMGRTGSGVSGKEDLPLDEGAAGDELYQTAMERPWVAVVQPSRRLAGRRFDKGQSVVAGRTCSYGASCSGRYSELAEPDPSPSRGGEDEGTEEAEAPSGAAKEDGSQTGSSAEARQSGGRKRLRRQRRLQVQTFSTSRRSIDRWLGGKPGRMPCRLWRK